MTAVAAYQGTSSLSSLSLFFLCVFSVSGCVGAAAMVRASTSATRGSEGGQIKIQISSLLSSSCTARLYLLFSSLASLCLASPLSLSFFSRDTLSLCHYGAA